MLYNTYKSLLNVTAYLRQGEEESHRWRANEERTKCIIMAADPFKPFLWAHLEGLTQV